MAESNVFRVEDPQYAPLGDPAAHFGGLQRRVSSLGREGEAFRAEDSQHAPLDDPASHVHLGGLERQVSSLGLKV